MGKRLLISGLLIAAITLLGLGGSALARERAACDQLPTPMNGMMGPGMMGPPARLGGQMGAHVGFADRPITLMLERRDDLKLTSEQVAKLETLRAGFEKKAEEGFRTLQEQHGELQRILGADRVHLAKAEATLKTIAALRTDIALKRIEVIEEGKSVLTEEQWATFKKLSAREHCPVMGT